MYDIILVGKSRLFNLFWTFLPMFFSIIEQFNGKQAVMKLLSAEDPNVRYHALLAIQKLMVHNWEYLGKQIDADVKVEVVPAN